MAHRKSPDLTLGVRFAAAGEALHGSSMPGAERDPLAGVRSMLDLELTKAMVAAEPQLLAWLRNSRDNLVQFTMDPMTALRAALPDFDPALISRIAAVRAVSQRAKVDLPGISVDRFTADVAPASKGK